MSILKDIQEAINNGGGAESEELNFSDIQIEKFTP